MSSPRPIVWISGYPGCGKTTAGDYLETYYGYVHIDVDSHFMLPRYEDGRPDPDDPALAGYMKSWKDFFSGGTPSPEDFGPFLELVLHKAKQLVAENKDARIVITQAMHREGRDWFTKRLQDETGQTIFFVGLAASVEKKMQRMKEKFEKFFPATEKRSHAEAFKERTGMELTDENFEKDWRETNATRIPLMSKFDMDADEIEEGRGCNVSLDEGDEKVLPSLKEAVHAGDASKDENLQEFFEESWKKLGDFARAIQKS
eukprot:TRINITY_DN57984_c0_g1_i1.p1 TRINITY_DN57984_c0_g1~~TRINITY_DN57984_c0_g1_i1.p1  ORF type:complete len:259 (-),score=52.88 TRINITY_DN57984_c0_g1_i1:46-822(-)